MRIATIAGMILGLVVVGVTFALTRMLGAGADTASIVMILAGCAVAGAGSFLVAHMVGLPRALERAHRAMGQVSVGEFVERHATAVGVIGGVGGLVVMVVVFLDPTVLGGMPAIALFGAVCGALLLNMWPGQSSGSHDQALTTDFGVSGTTGTRAGRADDFKKAA